MAWGHFGALSVDMLEPQAGAAAFDAFLARHGDGIFAVVYEAPSPDAMDREVARMRAAGVQVLERIRIETDRGAAAFTFFDTEPKGKYVLGLVYWPGGAAPAAAPAAVSHVAFAIREAKPVSDYWQQAGFPEMPVAHATPREDSRYHGMPLLLSFDVGWHRYSKPTFEWLVRRNRRPTATTIFSRRTAKASTTWACRCRISKPPSPATRSSATAWCNRAPGATSGRKTRRYCYMGTDSIGGVTAELIRACK